MKMMNKFFDTSSLLMLADSLFDEEYEYNIFISSITLSELEHIKTAANKDQNIKYTARQLLHRLDENPEKWICLIYSKEECEAILKKFDYEITNDTKILAAAYSYTEQNQLEIPIFVTNDMTLKMLAIPLFGISHIESIPVDVDDYTGYEEFYFSNDEMADFYSNPSKYGEQLKINEYVNIYEKDSKNRIDTLVWTGDHFRPLKYKSFISQQLGEIKPFKGDIYQAMVSDSLLNNRITMIKGPAGTGKTHLALGYLFHLLERGRIDKIIIFCNTVATKNSAKLGLIKG